jgi:hypothetical protein
MNALTVIESVDLQTVNTTLQKISMFQAIIQKTLRQGQDFDTIPGTNKPTLLKPGAEKINMLMGIVPSYDIDNRIEDFDKGFISYSFRCTLMRNGEPVSQGVGCCNSLEPKYKYIWAKEEEIPNHLDKDNLKTQQDKYGRYTKYQIVNPEIAGLANTILKMAKKRAYVDATLQVAALSDVFTQDLEDMREYLQSEESETMDVKAASALKITFGKNKGKALGELFKSDHGWVEWYKGSEKKDPVIMKAIGILEQAIIDDRLKKQKAKEEKPEDKPTGQTEDKPFNLNPEEDPFPPVENK